MLLERSESTLFGELPDVDLIQYARIEPRSGGLSQYLVLSVDIRHKTVYYAAFFDIVGKSITLFLRLCIFRRRIITA